MSCQPTPRAINFGTDMCAYCKMSVVDGKFASQLVSKKGKIFVFDAIECMVPFLNETKNTEYTYQLVCAFDDPGEMMNAETLTYIISENIPSPMGKNLSAYSKLSIAEEMISTKGGELYNWEELNLKLTLN